MGAKKICFIKFFHLESFSFEVKDWEMKAVGDEMQDLPLAQKNADLRDVAQLVGEAQEVPNRKRDVYHVIDLFLSVENLARVFLLENENHWKILSL